MNKKGYIKNIEEETLANSSFRKVVYTGNYTQLVFMTLKPGEEIGNEVHGNDQFFRIEEGEGEVTINGITTPIRDDWAIIVPAGAQHNVKNNGKTPLKLYTLYSVPHHRHNIEHITKEDAEADSEEFDGITTE